MALAFLLEWSGVTQDKYDAVVEDLGLHGKVMDGQLYHAAGPIEGGWRIVDVWESPERFETFLNTRLAPTLQRHGIGAPQVSPWPVHNTLTP
jgi:hypothetical protein